MWKIFVQEVANSLQQIILRPSASGREEERKVFGILRKTNKGFISIILCCTVTKIH